MKPQSMLWLAVGAGGLLWWFNGGKKLMTETLNPASDKNAVNTLANRALGLDNKTASIGTIAYDLTHWMDSRQRTAGFPKRYVNGKWYTQIGGKWLFDKYETDQGIKALEKMKKAAP